MCVFSIDLKKATTRTTTTTTSSWADEPVQTVYIEDDATLSYDTEYSIVLPAASFYSYVDHALPAGYDYRLVGFHFMHMLHIYYKYYSCFNYTFTFPSCMY